MYRRDTETTLKDSSGRLLATSRVELSGVPTFIADSGGKGSPVILIHGFGDSAEAWRRMTPRLTDRHRVLAIDLPPFGRSSRPPTTDYFSFYREILPDLCAHAGIDRAAVIGHSLGGTVALRLALDRPDLVERVGLIAPAALATSAPLLWRAASELAPVWSAILSIPNPLGDHLVRAGMGIVLRSHLVHEPAKLEDELERHLKLHGSRRELIKLIHAGRSCMAGLSKTLIDRADEISAEILLIWGDNDRLAPVGDAAHFAAQVSSAEVHVLKNCGHYPQLERARKVGALLGDFCDRAITPTRRRRVAARAPRTAAARRGGAATARRTSAAASATSASASAAGTPRRRTAA